jgi:hypothetical protein
MQPDSVKLTIRLPRQDLEFAKAYAKAHGLTVTEFIDRYLRQMREMETAILSPEMDFITGLVPSDVDAKEALRQHQQDKHG